MSNQNFLCALGLERPGTKVAASSERRRYVDLVEWQPFFVPVQIKVSSARVELKGKLSMDLAS